MRKLSQKEYNAAMMQQGVAPDAVRAMDTSEKNTFSNARSIATDDLAQRIIAAVQKPVRRPSRLRRIWVSIRSKLLKKS